MNYIAISPMFPKSYWNFCDRLKRNGVTVLGIGDVAYDELMEELKQSLTEYYFVRDMKNYDEMMRAVAYFIHKYGRIDWLESNNEYWLEQDAKLRSDFNITSGFQQRQLNGFKLKSSMKKAYQKAGIPCARGQLVTSYQHDLPFVTTIGYPLIVKPDNGVGASATYKIHNDEELQSFYRQKPEISYFMEEYIDGTIYSYDAIIDSHQQPIFETSHCFPTPIMEIVNERKDMAYYTVKDIPEPLVELGRRAVKAFHVKSRFIHFEFFKLNSDHEGLGKAGSWVALEVNMRPAGGYTPDMIDFANLCDAYQIYADMIAYDENRRPESAHKFYCVYASRFDEKKYKHTLAEIKSRYLAHIVMEERMPDILASAMGNQMVTARFKTFAQVQEFIDFVQK